MKDTNPISSDIKTLISIGRARRAKVFAYGFLFAFVACTAFLAFNSSNNSSSPWFDNLFSSSSANSLKASIAPYKSQVSSLFSHLFPNSSSSPLQPSPSSELSVSAGRKADGGGGPSKGPILGSGSSAVGALEKNQTRGSGVTAEEKGGSGVTEEKSGDSGSKESGVSGGSEKKDETLKAQDQSGSGSGSGDSMKSQGSDVKRGGVPSTNQTSTNEIPGKGSGVSVDDSKSKDQCGSGVTSETQSSGAEAHAKGNAKEKQVSNGADQSGSGASSQNQSSTKEKQVKNDSASAKNVDGAKKNGNLEEKNQSGSGVSTQSQSSTEDKQVKNESGSDKKGDVAKKNGNSEPKPQNGSGDPSKNQTPSKENENSSNSQKKAKATPAQNGQKNSELSSSLAKGNGSTKSSSSGNEKMKVKWIEDMIGCDIFNGQWVKDDSYPLYPEGSCPHIDEPFDCYLNGRPDRNYQKLRWQPHGCNIPRLNAGDMLERLRGKRLVFVGDSLNRNMWESLVCILKNSVKDKKKVFEASGRHQFRTEGSYSFLFKDYQATVEFFRSPFLVQEWEMHKGNATKETLRLDIIERSSPMYKDAHVIVFNTGHWWTHEKTSKGKDYYQEGNQVYSELNVMDAFHKALNTWAKWVDANVNPKKSLVFFRGYSASHFSGGQWNSGGACDKETEPIKNEQYLSTYPTKMSVLESVIKGMKTPVSYLNITRMTDYRKDAHPSVYRTQHLNEEERKDPLRFQDCSHWCLPGVPDSWNELLYAQLIIKQYQTGR